MRLEEVPEAGSTSETLKRRAGDGAGEVALLARRQTAGSGRLGRPWRSIEGNLTLSVLMRPASLRWPGHLSILCAVALLEALRGVAPASCPLRVKWPNDVLLQGGKVAGILLEAGTSGVPPAPWVVTGFGVNLAAAPEGLGRAVACVADVAAAPDARDFALSLLWHLDAWRGRYAEEGFAPVRAAWLLAGHAVGDELAVGMGAARVEGSFQGLGDDGALLLDGGRTITAGEVS